MRPGRERRQFRQNLEGEHLEHFWGEPEGEVAELGRELRAYS